MNVETTPESPGREQDAKRANKKNLELPPADQSLKAEIHSYTLLQLEGIGVNHVKRLARAGIRSLQSLFRRGATRKGRHEIAAEIGVDERKILNWVSRADLLRVRGIGQEYADLLERAGVGTPVELAHRKPENLHRSLLEVNETKRLTRRSPSLKQVTGWVHEAKRLPRAVEY